MTANNDYLATFLTTAKQLQFRIEKPDEYHVDGEHIKSGQKFTITFDGSAKSGVKKAYLHIHGSIPIVRMEINRMNELAAVIKAKSGVYVSFGRFKNRCMRQNNGDYDPSLVEIHQTGSTRCAPWIPFAQDAVTAIVCAALVF